MHRHAAPRCSSPSSAFAAALRARLRAPLRVALCAAVGLLGVLAPAAVAGEDGPKPVTVTVEEKTHPFVVAPFKDDTLYADKPEDTPELLAAKKAYDEVVKRLHDQFAEQEAEAYKELDRLKQSKDKAEKRKARGFSRQLYFKRRDWLHTQEAYLEVKNAKQQATQAAYKTEERTFPYVKMNNGLIEVRIAPTLAMRVVNAIDLRTGRSVAGWFDPTEEEEKPYTDKIGWSAGFSEVSFPYFEHGTSMDPAGWRIIEHEDGSATVAMNMRFTQWQTSRHLARYGHYSQRICSSWVTLKPGENKYTITYRVDNPTATRRGDRMWVNHRMHARVFDADHIIYPVGYIIPHGGGWVKPYWAEGNEEREYRNVSWFGLKQDYVHCGVYDPEHDANSMIIIDGERGPGMKLYTRNADGGFLELWTGSGYVFEDAGDFLPPYVPIEFAVQHYVASGIGRVDWANGDVAIAHDGGGWKMVATREAEAEVTDGKGAVLAKGPVGPATVLAGKGDDLVIKLDGKQVGAVQFPLIHTDTKHLQPKTQAAGGKYRIELEVNNSSPGLPNSAHAMKKAAQMLKKGVTDKEEALSLAFAVYRWGHFDLADSLLKEVGETPEADYLRGLIAWERGEKVDFGTANVDANYHRALLAIQGGKTDEAVAFLKKLIEERPLVYRPRLVLAYLTKDKEMAKSLAAENPASPEAQLVLEKLGVEGAAKAKADLLRTNPEAPEQLANFEKELTKGEWTHVKRFKPLLPKAEAEKGEEKKGKK